MRLYSKFLLMEKFAGKIGFVKKKYPPPLFVVENILVPNAYLTGELVPLPQEPSDGKHKPVCQKLPVPPSLREPKK